MRDMIKGSRWTVRAIAKKPSPRERGSKSVVEGHRISVWVPGSRKVDEGQ